MIIILSTSPAQGAGRSSPTAAPRMVVRALVAPRHATSNRSAFTCWNSPVARSLSSTGSGTGSST